MDTLLYILILVAAVAFFGAMYICSKKAKLLGGYYREIGVCGPVYAYICADLLLCSGGVIAGPIYAIITGDFLIGIFSLCLGGLIAFSIGFLMFRSAQKKCPIELRSKLFRDFVIMMIGYSFRLGLFMFYIIFKVEYELNKPRYYEDIYGNVYQAYPFNNALYDLETGMKIGILNDDNTMTKV